MNKAFTDVWHNLHGIVWVACVWVGGSPTFGACAGGNSQNGAVNKFPAHYSAGGNSQNGAVNKSPAHYKECILGLCYVAVQEMRRIVTR